TCSRPEAHLGTVTSAFEGFDAESLDAWDEVLDEAADLVANDEDPADVLTEYTNQRAWEGLQLGNHLLDRVLAESREGGGISVLSCWLVTRCLHEPVSHVISATDGLKATRSSVPENTAASVMFQILLQPPSPVTQNSVITILASDHGHGVSAV